MSRWSDGDQTRRFRQVLASLTASLTKIREAWERPFENTFSRCDMQVRDKFACSEAAETNVSSGLTEVCAGAGGTHTLASRVVCVRNAQLLVLGCGISDGPRALPPTRRVLTRAHSGFSSRVPAKHG